MNTEELISEICKDRITEKRDLISELADMSHNEVEEFLKEIKKLETYKTTTQKLWCSDLPEYQIIAKDKESLELYNPLY